jgi:hypothetical protein
MQRKGLVFLAALTLLVFGGVGVAYAVSASGNCSVSCTVPSAVSITVPSSHTLTVTVGSQTTTNLSITTKTNCGWSMTVYKDNDLTKGADTIPSSRLVYTSSTTNGTPQSSNTEFSTSGSPTNVVTSGTKTGESGATVTVNYKLTVNYDDNPGTYNCTHTYTITSI